MTGAEFMQLWEDTELRQYVVDQAKLRRCKKIEDQEDHVQEAWLAISCAPFGKKTEFYEGLAYLTIRHSYWKLNKERIIQNHR